MIYEELMLNNGGEELMPNLLENMHHAYADLKINLSFNEAQVFWTESNTATGYGIAIESWKLTIASTSITENLLSYTGI
ncbi:unnamed protein product [Schistosoma curassoni]|uniref:Reverse transcriptase domain-containing protein n=1 Tax=Schistosoma curassoni TaxID=6186 RepID=A0A183JS79_9TREM|nr:unnamed protein product [Schistosoma curassoni]